MLEWIPIRASLASRCLRPCMVGCEFGAGGCLRRRMAGESWSTMACTTGMGRTRTGKPSSLGASCAPFLSILAASSVPTCHNRHVHECQVCLQERVPQAAHYCEDLDADAIIIICAPSCCQCLVTAQHPYGLCVQPDTCNACHDFCGRGRITPHKRLIILMQSGGRRQSGGRWNPLLLLS